jgi:hypothetical protein
MEFTDSFIGNACKLSRCGNYIAHLQDEELLVRDFGSLVIVLRGQIPSAYSSVRNIHWSEEGVVALQLDKSVHFWAIPSENGEIFNREPVAPAISIVESFRIEKILMIWGEWVLLFSELELQVRVWRPFGPDASKSPTTTLPGASCHAQSGNGLAMYHPATKCIALYQEGNFARPQRVIHLEEPVTGIDIDGSSVLAWTNRNHMQLICIEPNSTPFYYRPVAEGFGLIAETPTSRFLAFCDAREIIHIFNKTTRTFFSPIPLQLSIAKHDSSLIFYKEVQVGKYEAQYANYIS